MPDSSAKSSDRLLRSRWALLDDIAAGDRFFLFLASGFLLAVVGWSAYVPLPVRVRALTGRVEPAARLHLVGPEVAGRVAALPVELGAQVAAGDPILLLEADHYRDELASAEKRLGELRSRAEALALEADNELKRLAADGAGITLEIASLERQLLGDTTAAAYAQRNLDQSQKLVESGLISRAERLRLEAEVARAQTVVDISELSRRKALEKWAGSQRQVEAKRAAFAAAQRQTAAEISQAEDAVEHLREELEHRVVTAPVAGKIGHLLPLRPGTLVGAGETVAEIIPEGPGQLIVAKVDARYLPRLHTGQKAWVRELETLEGGLGPNLPATVRAVGLPAADGSFQVELAVEQEAPWVVGAPVRAEIEVARRPLLEALLLALRN